MARPISATLSAMASALRSGRIRLSRNANMPRSMRDGSNEGVVHHFAETAAAGDDVLVLVQPALLVPPRAGDGGEDVGRAEPAVEAHGVDDHLGVAPAHVAQVLGRHDEV